MTPNREGSPTAGSSAATGRLVEIARLFAKLGLIAFGGPAAHIAMMEDEVVTRRGWIDRRHFLDLIGATNLIPGPNSTEMAMHVGYERAGGPGLVVAGSCFILPAALVTGVLGWLYVEYGTLYGVKPAVLAVILAAVWKLSRVAVKSRRLAAVGLAVDVAAVALMVAVTLDLGAAILVSWPAWAIALVAAAVSLRYRVGAAWLVLGAALLGWLLSPS